MPRKPFTPKHEQQLDQLLVRIGAWEEDAARAERCGNDCSDDRQKVEMAKGFAEALKREYCQCPSPEESQPQYQ